MNKKLILIPTIALLIGGGLLNLNYAQNFVIKEYTNSQDKLFLNAKVKNANKLNFTNPDNDTPIGVQETYDKEKDKLSLRFIGAIKVQDTNGDGTISSEELSNTTAVWHRGMFRTSGVVKAYAAKQSNAAYHALSAGGGTYTIDDYNNDHGTNYTHFVTYVLKDIPFESYRYAFLDVYLTVNGIDTRGVLTSIERKVEFSYKPIANGYFGVKKNDTEGTGSEAFEFTSYTDDVGTYRAHVDLAEDDKLFVFRKHNNEMSYVQYATDHEYSLYSRKMTKVNGGLVFDTGNYTLLIKGTDNNPKLALINSENPLLDGNYVEYGLYPQTHVSDEDIIQQLDALPSAGFNGWYRLNDKFYAKLTATPQGNSQFDDGEDIEYNSTYWFECRPIKWKIINSNDGKSLAISSSILDEIVFSENETETVYGETINANNWNYSSARKWLNDDFFKQAFVLGNSRIETKKIDNSAASTGLSSNPYTCGDTFDKVFLPSQAEMQTYKSKYSDSYDGEPSDWAKAKGAIVSTDGNSDFISRSPYNTNDSFVSGFRGTSWLSCNSLVKGGIRPAISLKVDDNDSSNLSITYGQNYVNYGEYPQTHVKNKITVDIPGLQSSTFDNPIKVALNSLYNDETKQPNSKGWYEYDSKWYAPYVVNAYVVPDGSHFSDGDEIVKNQLEWFEVEPISWRILSRNNGEYLVLSEKALNAHDYSDGYSQTTITVDNYEYGSANYDYSIARNWLNGEFFNTAFGGINTNNIKETYKLDKLFILNEEDLNNQNYGFTDNASRQCAATDYGLAQGLISYSYLNYYAGYHVRSYSPSNDVKYVGTDGDLWTGYGRNWVGNPATCLRPAMYLRTF